MADDFIWLNEYLTLVDWIRSRWGGKVTRRFSDRYGGFGGRMRFGTVNAETSALAEDGDDIQDIFKLDTYPAYEGAIEGIPLGMALSDSDELSMSIEYMMKWEIEIRHEHWADRMFKKLRLDYEFKSGDANFDREYYIKAKNPSHRDIFQEARLQDLIRDLEPFEWMITTPGRLGITRKIVNADLLRPDEFEKFIGTLHEVARFLKR